MRLLGCAPAELQGHWSAASPLRALAGRWLHSASECMQRRLLRCTQHALHLGLLASPAGGVCHLQAADVHTQSLLHRVLLPRRTGMARRAILATCPPRYCMETRAGAKRMSPSFDAPACL